MRKILAMLLAISLFAGLLPMTVFAADAGPARFVFAAKEKVTDLEVIINQGDAPVYLKTAGKKATAEGATESNYHIKITYNAGENPKLYLKGAEIQTYGDANSDPAIIIGSEKAEDGYNDLNVDIIVEKNSTFSHTQVWGDSHIKSYITGTLTITRVKGTLVMGHKMCRQAAIYSVGDIVLKDLYATITSGWSSKDRGNAIQSAQGSITIDGGKITITTKTDTPGTTNSAINNRVIFAESGEDIVVQNGATLKVTMAYSGKVFGTTGDVIFKDSTVEVTVNSDVGTMFNGSAPVIDGYADGYIALGDDAEYDANNFEAYKKFSITPAAAATEPTTEPTTAPTTAPTEPSAPATEPSAPATQPSAPATQPSAPATEPADKNNTQPKNNMDINTIILVVGLIVIVAAAAASAVIIIKKKNGAVEAVAEEKTEE